ncbi:MAG: hypothetical protein LBB50_05640, partial [Oscillospiraceae bacterium]|nr:hypothetical protein [Oscillospiraceae bacterium]
KKPENRDVTGTGSLATLWNEGESHSYGGYIMVVFGDLDGNFLIDLDDWAELRAMLAGSRPAKMAADSPYFFAADVNHDALVDEADLALLYRAALGTAAIAQTY